MKRYIIVGILLALFLGGCTEFTARKDENRIVTFKNSDIKKGAYTLTLYRIEYPETPVKQDEFYKKFNLLISKMTAHNKDINLLIPFELYQDFINLKKQDVRVGEKIFSKPVYALTESDKNFIDKNISVKYPEDAGSFQKYLNKQTAYWYEYLKRGSEYEAKKYYTELDKNKLIGEVIESRKRFSDLSLLMKHDYALEVNGDNISEAGKTGLPLYIPSKYIDPEQLENISSKIIVTDKGGKNLNIPGKMVFIAGGSTKNIKDYEITTEIKNIYDPVILIQQLDEKGLKLKEMENFEIRKVSSVQAPEASVREKEIPRETMNFINIESGWRIDK